MIAARRAQKNRQSRCPGPRKLLGMHPRSESPLASSLQNPLRFRNAKRPAVAKHVAKLRKLVFGDGRQKIFLEQLDVPLRSVRLFAKFLGHDMRAEKCRHNLERLFRRQLLVKLEDLQFAWTVQSITALSLNRRCA